MRLAPVFTLLLLLGVSGCAFTPFHSAPAGAPGGGAGQAPEQPPGSGPVVTSPETGTTAPAAEPGTVTPAPTPLPRERPRTAPATLSPASKALVGQAQAQRKKGDLPGATVSLERALRIEPNNPLLWIEMGRLRMDQHNFPQAESMGRKALSMAVGDNRTQSAAWQLIADALKARGRNPQAQEAQERARELSHL